MSTAQLLYTLHSALTNCPQRAYLHVEPSSSFTVQWMRSTSSDIIYNNIRKRSLHTALLVVRAKEKLDNDADVRNKNIGQALSTSMRRSYPLASGINNFSRGTRRVVITGVGLVSPLGCGHEDIWRSLLASQHGISYIPAASVVKGAHVTVAGFVPRSPCNSVANDTENLNNTGNYDEEAVFGRNVSKELANFSQYAILASDLALAHAKLHPAQMSSSSLERAGVAVASGGIGSIQDVVDSTRLLDQSYKKVSPYFVPKILSNLASGHVSIKHGFKGPVTSVSTACAAGTHSIGDAFNFIRLGYADVMLAGGSESCITPLTIAGFSRMRALGASTDPGTASRPFDSTRDGFIISEGAGILVLEDLQFATDRGATIIAEVLGYGLSGDAHHATHPPADGSGAERSMLQALNDAGLTPHDIGYINAHATSTPIGDAIEVCAIEKVFGNRDEGVHGPLFVSSTKGAIGHLLGAAGAVETAFTALALRDGTVPPTLNLQNPDAPPISFHHVPNTAIIYDKHNLDKQESQVNNANTAPKKLLLYALKNSFGFGGMNATLVLSKFLG